MTDDVTIENSPHAVSPEFRAGISAVVKTNRTKQVAMMIEAALHEAGHAVVSLALGGHAFRAEILWTEKQRKENNAWGMCGIGDLPCPLDRMTASVGGPIAASMVTGFIRQGTDYMRPRLESLGASHEDAEIVQAAEMYAEQIVLANWPAIERLAGKLLRSKGKKTFSGNAICALMQPGSATPASTKATVPQEAFYYWEQFLKAHESHDRKALGKIGPKIPRASDAKLRELKDQWDMTIWRLRQSYGGKVLDDGSVIKSFYV